ncbi:levan regulatory protein [Enterobacter cancerogenus]|nr:hypothetical protein [Enterobacter cancerogenus]KGT88729.1 levan regulatory protein [Enterobacter cancerogenus]
MQDFLLESVQPQRIDLFLKLVAMSDCKELEKSMAIEWVSERTDEHMARLRNHEYSRSMHQLE